MPHLPSRRRTLAALALLAAGLFLSVPAEAQYFRFGKNKVQYEVHDWNYLQSRYFDVYYYEGGYHLANYTAKAAEAAYAQVSALFSYEITDRIPIIVYQSHNDFSVTNAFELPANAEGIGGVTEIFKNRVAVPFTGDYRDYRRVLHHELVHAVLNDMLYGGSLQSIIQSNIRLRVPDWLNEGLAEYAALGWDTHSDMYVREAVLEDNLAPIPYLGGYFAYRGGQSVWDYIAEQYGREKISEILQRIRLTRNVEGSFRRATGLSMDELSERWQKALKEIYFPEVAAREDLDDIAKALITREDGYLNTSPALSPQGDRIAFITTRGALFDVYLASAEDGKIIRKLIEGQNSTEFESLRILTPGLSWSPDGRRIAVAVKSGRTDAIAVVDVESRHSRHYRVPGIDQIVSVAWSPVDSKIAFEGVKNHQSDIYVFDLFDREAVNLTDDLFSDHEPAWSPDGKSLVFHSDRGTYLETRRFGADSLQMAAHDYSQYDLYRLRIGEPLLRRLTYDPAWDDRSARFSPDGERILFISDRNGVFNLYEKALDTGVERPITDDVVGVTQLSLSADGRKAALVSLREGTSSIYVLPDPFERRMEAERLAPNVWAQRALGRTAQDAPSVALASPSVRQNNPLLRDARDGVAYARDRDRAPDLLASRTPVFPDSLAPELAAADTFLAVSDTALYGGVRVAFAELTTHEDPYEDGLEDDEVDPFAVRNNVDEDGNYKERRYKLSFSSDLVYGTAGYDMLYGVQGVTQVMFSDMLGDHQIFLATNLLVDLRSSDYQVSYSYLPRRLDWGVSGFHVSRLLHDYRLETASVYQYRQYGVGGNVSYPLDKFRRIEAELNVLGVSQADVLDPARSPETWSLIHPSVTFTKDVSTPGLLSPMGGHRFALSLSGSPGNVAGPQTRFATLLGDARAYTAFGRGLYSVGLRASAGVSVGPDQQLFYSSGVQNWINRNFDEDNGFPINDVSDFVFATPVMPLRGYSINAQNGSNFGLLNAEARFPLFAALLPGPLPLVPLYHLQGVFFVDAASLWGGRGGDKRWNLIGRNETGRLVLDDVLIGAGFGLRTVVLGYPLRLEYAWPFDGRSFGDRQVYLSLGFDF